MTKDEKFLVELFRRTHTTKETIDPFKIGHELGYKDHLITNILRGLMQANLIKRYAPDEVGLTERGLEVAKSLTR